jgi:hypothetical protein
MLTYKHRLPWITNSLRKLISKKNKLYKKRNDTKYSNAYVLEQFFLGLGWFFAGGWSGSFTGRSQMIDSM